MTARTLALCGLAWLGVHTPAAGDTGDDAAFPVTDNDVAHGTQDFTPFFGARYAFDRNTSP